MKMLQCEILLLEDAFGVRRMDSEVRPDEPNELESMLALIRE